jgi:hypothetical protein
MRTAATGARLELQPNAKPLVSLPKTPTIRSGRLGRIFLAISDTCKLGTTALNGDRGEDASHKPSVRTGRSDKVGRANRASAPPGSGAREGADGGGRLPRAVAPRSSRDAKTGASRTYQRQQLGHFWLWQRPKCLTWHICWLERDSAGRSVTRRKSIAARGGSKDAPPQEAIDALATHYVEATAPEAQPKSQALVEALMAETPCIGSRRARTLRHFRSTLD